GLVNPAERGPVVKQALKKLYDDAMYSTLYYSRTLEAYRNDRFTGFVAQPSASGALASQLGTWSYRAITPYTAPVNQPAGKGATILWIIVGTVVVASGLVTALLLVRRRSTADERE